MTIWSSSLATFEFETGESGISALRLAEDQVADVSAETDALIDSLNEHLAGRAASLRLDLQSVKSSIGQLTLAKLLEIPYGEVRSYAWVAKEISHPAAVRPVANAVAGNPVPVLIPCHRVVRSDGHLGNYSLGAELKRKLLEFEGLDVDYMEGFAQRGVRFLAEKETNIYHLPSCKLAPKPDSGTLQEIKNIDQALDANLDPCPRCRPV